MPTYDYHCNACGKDMEIFHSMTEPARKKCPQCGKSALERKIGTGGAVIFKGSGFYITDYRSDSYKKAAKGDASSGSGKEPAGGTSSGSASKDAGAAKPTQPAKKSAE